LLLNNSTILHAIQTNLFSSSTLPPATQILVLSIEGGNYPCRVCAADRRRGGCTLWLFPTPKTCRDNRHVDRYKYQNDDSVTPIHTGTMRRNRASRTMKWFLSLVLRIPLASAFKSRQPGDVVGTLWWRLPPLC